MHRMLYCKIETTILQRIHAQNQSDPWEKIKIDYQDFEKYS